MTWPSSGFSAGWETCQDTNGDTTLDTCVMTADLLGDYRDEVVCTTENRVLVFSNLEPATRREVTRAASREYRLWMARNMGGGYASYFEWEP